VPETDRTHFQTKPGTAALLFLDPK